MGSMKLATQRFGDSGPCLVVLHGLLGSARNWASMARFLSQQGLQVVLLDLRNHGQSGWSEEVNFEVMADDVAETVQSLHLPCFCLAGHSLGGKVAMRLAMDHPHLLERLAVVDIAPKAYKNHYLKDFESMLSLDLQSMSSRREADMLLSMQVPNNAHRQFLLTNLRRDEQGHLCWGSNLRALYRGMDTIKSNPLEQQESFAGPTCFIVGERSEYLLPEDEALLQPHFSHLEVVRIDKAGHNVHTDQPEPFARALTRFIKG